MSNSYCMYSHSGSAHNDGMLTWDEFMKGLKASGKRRRKGEQWEWWVCGCGCFVCVGVWMGGVLKDAVTTCSLCWTSLCAACLYIITRPDSLLLCTRVYILWFSLTWGSATFWWQSNACNCSMFCACTRSGLPHNVVHFLVMVLVFVRVLSLRWCYKFYSPRMYSYGCTGHPMV